ncbi:MAG TPA: heme NO-binding domain-containing protein [Chloroflexota bacterium]|jgi:hypothetical protein
MKGIVFTLLQEVVTKEHGERTWDSLLESAGLEGAYTAVGTYPDQELVALVAAAAAALQSPPDDVLRWFGRKALPLLAGQVPQVFQGHTSTQGFLLTLNEVIHPEVRKLFPGAYAPEFDFTLRDNGLALGYTSARRLCSFAEGLILGAADYFGERAEVIHEQCMKRGDATCRLSCTFSAVPL